MRFTEQVKTHQASLLACGLKFAVQEDFKQAYEVIGQTCSNARGAEFYVRDKNKDRVYKVEVFPVDGDVEELLSGVVAPRLKPDDYTK